MCGITGFIGISDHYKLTQKSLDLMKNRGSDSSKIISYGDLSIGHNLHSIVGFVEQPFEDSNSIFAVNCEIYNWEELAQKYDLKVNNDAELFFKLISLKGIENIKFILEELDGVFAFVYFDKNSNLIYLGRDLIGVKPLFYSNNCASSESCFSLSSEKKTLRDLDFKSIKELNPRQVLIFNPKTNNLDYIQREFFSYLPELDISSEDIESKLEDKLVQAVLKRIPKDKHIGILFSGGIDSTIIAWICKKNNIPFTCYTAAVSGFGDSAQDLIYSKKIAEDYDFPLRIATVDLDELEPYVDRVSKLIESNNVTKVGVALPFFIASELANKDGVKVIFSGLGSEEIFAGYERHAISAGIGKQGYDSLDYYDSLDIGNVNKECLSGLYQIHERDLYRDDVVTMFNQIELRLPFLDYDLVKFSLKIPPKYKISSSEKIIILRNVSENLGLKKEYARRPKKAAQYGSKFDRALGKLAKKQGFSRKSDYLKQFYTDANLRLGSLLSTGKDSLYATYIMANRNYEISCFLTIDSIEENSFLFHTPAINLAKLQAEAAGIPLLVQRTDGVKEKELDDLKSLLKKAKDKYQIEGIVSGALFSTYQRDRFEKVCDELGLICWNPLWHKNQESYMFELLDNDFKFIMSKVMAEGLDDKWVNKVIEVDDVSNLVKLNSKVGINIAGEGGEFETFVLDCPLFSKKLVIDEFELVHDSERFETVTVLIKKISFKQK